MAAKADEAARLLSTLAHGKRLLALCHMLRGEVSVGRLAELIDLSPTALSQHLARMRDLNLVETRREGQTIYYRLASREVAAILETLYGLYCAPAGCDADAAPAAAAPPRRAARG
ncbi:metalloregulator ArsR/SmtB family transcription factor [Roseomonas sp. AR75]|uniref:ArsR/SmtB family transcription factor n=1 Tax=Roseomonas sp. AR75 TaxID=2562311 RepID=UPI00197EE9D5|nr:metalloregulator ArsR/SmtB family transcription factor [Roseomonas sp. AR75]